MEFFHLIGNFLLFMTGLVMQVWQDAWKVFIGACAIGVFTAGLAWWLSHLVALNCNRQFSFRIRHHFLCSLAAIATFIFTLLFAGFRYTGDVAEGMVKIWEISIRTDTDWNRKTYEKAYEAVYALRDASGNQLEDFTGKPHPKTGRNTLIPTSHETSQLTAAETYAKGAVDHFRVQYPFLSKILWAHSSSAQQGIVADMKRVFKAAPGGTYKTEDAIRIAGEQIRRGLEKQVPRVVLISRILLVIAFILLQAITLALLIRAALADIKENFSPQPIKGQ
ncbi:MAG: hypothetical protein GY757_17360 [bacterium]|nr:hypothetical protein [bacterium]